jgi:hypothetical protein
MPAASPPSIRGRPERDLASCSLPLWNEETGAGGLVLTIRCAGTSASPMDLGGVVQNRRSKISRPRPTRHQTRHHSQVILVASAPACHRVLVSMVPSAA